MTATRSRLSSARKYLEAFEESWQTDHDAAMHCREVEKKLAEAVMVFELVDRLVDRRREGVFRGVEEPNPKLDEDEKALYTRWLTLIEEYLPRLEEMERTFGVMEGADRLRATLDRARSFLAEWAPAAPALAVGSRLIEFSEEDADQVHALLESPAGSPGRPTRPPRSVPPGDQSLLR
jgi:hypothetical protein